MTASVIMLLGFMALYFQAAEVLGYRTFDIPVLTKVAPSLAAGTQLAIFTALFFGFGVKMPVVPFHTWLPDAHVDAPTAGSVLLAGLLLKMGGYGLIRLALPLASAATAAVPVMFVFAVVSIIYAAVVCMPQRDLKRLVAYSSVSHMGLVLLGVAAYSADRSNYVGLAGAVFQMFAHGLVTAVLFMMAGSIHHHAGTREIEQLGGIARKMPVSGTVLTYGALASLGLPGLVSFPSELLVFFATYNAFGLLVFLPLAGVVLTAGYYLWMLQRALFGPFNANLKKVSDLSVHEAVPLGLLMFLIGLFGALPYLMLRFINFAAGGSG